MRGEEGKHESLSHQIRAFLLGAHDKSTYFPKLRNAHRNKECHTEPKFSTITASGNTTVRTHGGRIHVWSDPPSYLCYLLVQAHTLGGETAVGVWRGGAETRWPYEELCRPVSGRRNKLTGNDSAETLMQRNSMLL